MRFRNYRNYSVVIPTAKAGPHIRASILSMVNQTITPSEILVILNNYDSVTLSEALQISQEYPIVKLYEANVHSCSCATNFGITKAKTHVIMRMDADDIAHPQRAELQLQLLSDGADVVGASIQSFGSTRKKWLVHKSDKYLKSLALFQSPLPGPTLTFVNDPELRYTNGYNHGEDCAFVYSAIQKGFTLAGVKKPLVHYRVHDKSMTNKDLTSDEVKLNSNIITDLKVNHWSRVFGKDKANLLDVALQDRKLNNIVTLINKYDADPSYITHRLITSKMINVSPLFALQIKLKSFIINK